MPSRLRLGLLVVEGVALLESLLLGWALLDQVMQYVERIGRAQDIEE